MKKLLILLLFFFSASFAIQVKVFTPKKERINIYYEADGRSVAERNLDVKPEVSGIVEEIFVKEGQTVKKGQKLLKIKQDNLIYRYQRQKAVIEKQKENLRYLEFLYERKKILFEKQLISEDEFRLAEKNYIAAKSDLKALESELLDIQEELKKTTVKAPFEAVLDKKYVNEGDFVSTATKLFYIYDPDSIVVGFYLPQRFIDKVKLEDKVIFFLNGKKHTAKITYISSSLTPESLIFVKAKPVDVKLRFENLFLKVKFVEKSFLGYRLPEASVHMKKSKVFVYTVKDGKVKVKPINVVSQQYGYIITDTPFKNDEKVILQAPFDIKEGMKVETVN